MYLKHLFYVYDNELDSLDKTYLYVLTFGWQKFK